MQSLTCSASRRDVLKGVAALALLRTAGGVSAHGLLGPVTPALPLPALAVTLHDGRRLPLAAVLRGRLTALQLMFTGCSSVCPVQGAVFAELQGLLRREAAGRAPMPQLLSISIDALGDDAPALARWRAQFGADADWRAGVPDLAEVDRLLDTLRGRSTGVDRHSAQVFIVDGAGRLVYRCAELASATAVAQVLRQIRGPSRS
ncbi:SCO family protein [Sphaerotilus sp.]|uniref:SCO family protein n=1 Tax=Sphaerotilus sp. TaxID=2093942 RepID=UPI002ACE1473|nr:SCO family protein [Sphaerotilus sp.]MDZ7858163.1 SCO family protein [Sphaerotilus sp.]